MTIARLLLALAARPVVELVGTLAAGGSGSTLISFPTGTQSGDLCVITFYTATTNISGGAGIAWNIQQATPTSKMAWRLLAPNDLTTPLNMDAASPFVAVTFRNAQAVSASRSDVTFTTTNGTLPGFTKSSNSEGLFLIGNSDAASISFPGVTGTTVGNGEGTYNEYVKVTVDRAQVASGATISVQSNSGTATKHAAAFEILT